MAEDEHSLPGLEWKDYVKAMDVRLARTKQVIRDGGLATPGAIEHLEKTATKPMGAAARYFGGRESR